MMDAIAHWVGKWPFSCKLFWLHFFLFLGLFKIFFWKIFWKIEKFSSPLCTMGLKKGLGSYIWKLNQTYLPRVYAHIIQSGVCSKDFLEHNFFKKKHFFRKIIIFIWILARFLVSFWHIEKKCVKFKIRVVILKIIML